MGSHGIKDRVAIVGMGCTPFGEHWDKSTDDLLIDSTPGGVRVGRARPRTTSTRTGSARWARARVRAHAVASAEARLQAGHARRELLRHRLRGVPQRVLRGRVRRVRHRDGGRRREAEGLRASPGSSARSRRTTARTSPLTAPAMFSLLAPAYREKYGVVRGGDEGRPHPHRVEEPLQRRAQPACAVPQRGAEGSHLHLAAHRRTARHLRLLGRVRRLGGGDHRARRGRVASTPTSRST